MKSKSKDEQSESDSTGFLRAKNMVCEKSRESNLSIRGFTLIELLVVLAITVLLSAIALPQMLSQRRLMRSVGVTREIMTQLRYTQQAAMSQRRAFTFQYDDTTKQISIIGPIPPGPAGLVNGAYPNNAGSAVVSIPLGRGGLNSGEISYGIPTTATGLPPGAAALPTGPLGDLVSETPLVNSQLNITFQPDGSVIDAAGNPMDRAMFIFNNRAAVATASAISVLGSSGRVKVWRYSQGGNIYAE